MAEKNSKRMGKLSIILNLDPMNKKKIISQVIAGVILFTIISVVLEKDYSQSVWLEKFKTALLFGVLYAIFILIKEKFKKK